MFVESLESLPEELREQFVETEIDGKKGYQDKDSHELRQHMLNIKGENKALKEAKAAHEQTLREFEQSKQAEIEQAREEALEKARTNGDVKAIEERYQQQMADLKKRSEESEAQHKQRLEALEKQIKTDKRSAIVSELSAELAHDRAHKAFKALVSSRIDIDPATGQPIFLDESGGATSLDLAGFKAEIEKDDAYAPLLKSGIVTSGGGQVNGSGIGGAKSSINDMSESERRKLLNTDPEAFKRMVAEAKSKR